MAKKAAQGAPVIQDLDILFDQVAAVLEANGLSMDDDAMRYLMPLLKGEQTLEENRAMISAMIERLEPDA